MQVFVNFLESAIDKHVLHDLLLPEEMDSGHCRLVEVLWESKDSNVFFLLRIFN